jgi:hypothetical protein
MSNNNKSQIFKEAVPLELLIHLLNNICAKNDKHYILDTIAFKSGIFNGSIQQFIQDCKPYYFYSKLKYLDRKLTYKNFLTIIRQICNHNNLDYHSQIKYDKSKYEIVYTIYNL